MKFASYVLVVLAAGLVFVVFSMMTALVDRTRQASSPADTEKINQLHIALANLQLEIESLHNRTAQHNISIRPGTVWEGINTEAVRQPSAKLESTPARKTPQGRNIGHKTAVNEVNKGSKRALIFTMDSIGSYEKDSLSGGAAGNV